MEHDTQRSVLFLEPPIDPGAFDYWKAASLSKERLPIMLDLFIKGLQEGPTRTIDGCRRRPIFSEWLKPNCGPPTYFDYYGTEYEEVTIKALLREELQGMSKKTLKNLNPISGDWGFLKGAQVTLTDFVFRGRMIPTKVSQAIMSDGKVFSSWAFPNSGGRKNGRSWRISCEGPVMPSPLAFFIFSQVAIPCATSQEEMRKPGVAFLKAFTGEWYVDSWNRWCVVEKFDNWEHIQFHLRYFSVSFSPLEDRGGTARESGRLGIKMSREHYRARHHKNTSKDGDSICFTESRISLSICMSTVSASPSFTIVIATDSTELCKETLDDKNGWTGMGNHICLCEKLPNLSLFQATLYQLIKFQYSKVFRAICALRQAYDICPLWVLTVLNGPLIECITEVRRHLKSLMKDSIKSSCYESLVTDYNWGILISFAESRERKLLDMIRGVKINLGQCPFANTRTTSASGAH